MLHRPLIVFILALAFLPCASLAEKEQPLPKDLPPYGELKPIAAPKVTEQKLSNGLTLWLVPRPGFPKVAVALAVRGGMAADPKALPGLSDLLVATVTQGTKTRNAKKIAEEVQAAGGDLTGSATPDALVLSTEVLASKVEAALAAMADVSQNATFPENEVDLAKRNAADALRGQEADPSFLARRALARALFGDHPYSVISATQESIAKTTSADLRQDYARRFRPDQTLLVVVGEFDPARLAASVQNLFGKWTAPSETPAASVQPPSAPNPRQVFLVERQGSVQTTLALGAFGPTEHDPDFAATEMANGIFGGMFGSRLIKNIREDKGYTYSPGAFVQSRRAAGILETRADVRNEVTGASLNEISYELNRMVTTAPSEDELTHARRFLVGVRALSLQSQASVARQLAGLWVQDLPPEELGQLSEKILKVTGKEVEDAARKYFPFSHQTIVAVGEEKVVKEQLAPFGVEIKPTP